MKRNRGDKVRIIVGELTEYVSSENNSNLFKIVGTNELLSEYTLSQFRKLHGEINHVTEGDVYELITDWATTTKLCDIYEIKNSDVKIIDIIWDAFAKAEFELKIMFKADEFNIYNISKEAQMAFMQD